MSKCDLLELPVGTGNETHAYNIHPRVATKLKDNDTHKKIQSQHVQKKCRCKGAFIFLAPPSLRRPTGSVPNCNLDFTAPLRYRLCALEFLLLLWWSRFDLSSKKQSLSNVRTKRENCEKCLIKKTKNKLDDKLKVPLVRVFDVQVVSCQSAAAVGGVTKSQDVRLWRADHRLGKGSNTIPSLFIHVRFTTLVNRWWGREKGTREDWLRAGNR